MIFPLPIQKQIYKQINKHNNDLYIKWIGNKYTHEVDFFKDTNEFDKKKK